MVAESADFWYSFRVFGWVGVEVGGDLPLAFGLVLGCESAPNLDLFRLTVEARSATSDPRRRLDGFFCARAESYLDIPARQKVSTACS